MIALAYRSVLYALRPWPRGPGEARWYHEAFAFVLDVSFGTSRTFSFGESRSGGAHSSNHFSLKPSAPAASNPLEGTVLKVGATPAPHAEILEVVKGLLAEQGITLEIVEFNDYIQPNLAVENGELDANYFQHVPYMNEFNVSDSTHLVSAADVHYEPFGLYAGKTASIADLADGAQIAVPNDTTNEARALLLLEQEGLITLKEGAGITATKADIAENPKNLDIVELEANQLPVRLADVDMAVINAVAIEAADGEAATAYVNVLAVKEGNEDSPAIQALAAALTSQEVKDFIDETYAGAVVPVF